MIVKQTKLFGQLKKKLHKNQIQALNKAVAAISQNPKIGEQKKGDLSSIRVYKFKAVNQEFLLAYQIIGYEIILLHTVGVHENFYRDLKRVLT